MTFDEAYAEFKKASFGNEDFEQDCIVLFLENKDADVSEIIRKVKSKRTREYFDNKKIAPNLYNENGECITDDIYFVEPDPTAEINETNNITDEIREQGIKIARLMRITAELWKKTKKWNIEFSYKEKKKACVFNRRSTLNELYKISRMLSGNYAIKNKLQLRDLNGENLRYLKKGVKND